jgi:hypothetical protein
VTCFPRQKNITHTQHSHQSNFCALHMVVNSVVISWALQQMRPQRKLHGAIASISHSFSFRHICKKNHLYYNERATWVSGARGPIPFPSGFSYSRRIIFQARRNVFQAFEGKINMRRNVFQVK